MCDSSVIGASAADLSSGATTPTSLQPSLLNPTAAFHDDFAGVSDALSIGTSVDLPHMSPTSSQSPPLVLGGMNALGHTPTPPMSNDHLLSGTSLASSLDLSSPSHIPNGLSDTPINSPTLPSTSESYKMSLTPQQRFKQEVV